MTLSTLKQIIVGTDAIRLQIDNQMPLIEYRNEVINHIWILCRKCECLNNPCFINQFAEIANFLWKGASFQFLEQVAEYQKKYCDQVELEQTHLSDVFPYRLTDYKIFDVSVMHEPRLIEGCLHFYVFNVSTGLPYRVVCPFPYTCLSSLVHYQILPLKG